MKSYYTVEYHDGKSWRLGVYRIEGKRVARKIEAAYKMGNFKTRIMKETF